MTEQQEKYEVAVRDPVLVPTWALMREQATVLHKSGFFQKNIKSPEAALVIMLAGRELGIGPMESLRSIYIVNGQATIMSGLMAAMIWQKGHAYCIDESTDKVCQITFTRSNGQTYTHSFTHADAAKAGLAGKAIWKQYEKAMLFNRCMSAGARVFMPDVTRKLYTPEEMGAPVTVSESGDVVIDAEVTVIEDEHPDGADWTKTVSWASFWTHWKSEKGLSEDNIHEAAGVKSMKDYPGTKDELRAVVDVWIEAQMKASQEEAAAEEAANQELANREAAIEEDTEEESGT